MRRGKGGSATADNASKNESRSAWFKKLDANSDGFVTADEFQARAGKRGHKRSESPQQ
jgi:hypothetical protein